MLKIKTVIAVTFAAAAFVCHGAGADAQRPAATA